MNDEVLFNAVLSPNRSLAKNGFLVVLGLTTLLCMVGGALFLLMGAWPVTGFLGLDLALLYVALRLSYRSGFLTETVQLRRASLTVSRFFPNGREASWRFQPYWLKVEFNHEADHNNQVILTSTGKRLSVGSFLSPEERTEFATALMIALHRCRGLTNTTSLMSPNNSIAQSLPNRGASPTSV